MKKNLILAFALTIITTFSVNQLSAQTKEDAGNAFNAALELYKNNNMAGAIIKMQEVVTMCTALGAEGDTIKMSAAKVIPAWQYNIGNNLKNEKKVELAISAYEKSNEFAILYADDNIKEKSENQLVMLYTNKGSTLLKAEKADSAMLFLDKALKLNPEYSKALFTKGQVCKKQGDNEKMVENMELAIASAAKTNDTIIIKAAKNNIGNLRNQEGLTAYNKKMYGDAVSKLNTALSYGVKSKDLYYALSSSYNGLKKYDESIEAANAGLALEEQTDLKLARYYCEIAKAYEGKKDISNACEYYRKSAFGAYAAFSNDKIKNTLKCQ